MKLGPAPVIDPHKEKRNRDVLDEVQRGQKPADRDDGDDERDHLILPRLDDRQENECRDGEDDDGGEEGEEEGQDSPPAVIPATPK